MLDKSIQKISNQIPSQLSEDDWCQVRETIVLLNIATAQIEFSMSDGDESIDVLTDTFTSMSEGVHTISEAVESFSKYSDIDPKLHKEVAEQCETLSGDIQKSIVAFQFYDRLVQRLSHVRHSMSNLTTLIGTAEQSRSTDAWLKLQEAIRASCTMEEDKQLFDSIIAGKPIIDALKQLLEEKEKTSGADDDIELF